MSVPNLFSQETPSQTKGTEKRNILRSFPLIAKRMMETGKNVMEVLKDPIGSISHYVRRKLSEKMPGLFSENPPEEKKLKDTQGAAPAEIVEPANEVQKPFSPAKDEEKNEMEKMGMEFEIVSNQYRKDAGLKILNRNSELMSLAKDLADKQVNCGALKHSTMEERQRDKIEGEILVSGFSFPTEALDKFVNSPTHYKALMGSFTDMGYAIREGIERKSGKKMYFLAVVYRGGKTLKDEKDVPKKTVPSEKEIPEYKSLNDALESKPVLKKYFTALDILIKNKNPEISYEFVGTTNISDNEKKRGSFEIIVNKAEKKISYVVSCSPALLNRYVGNKKFEQVEFENLLEDFEKSQDMKLEPVEEEVANIIPFPKSEESSNEHNLKTAA